MDYFAFAIDGMLMGHVINPQSYEDLDVNIFGGGLECNIEEVTIQFAIVWISFVAECAPESMCLLISFVFVVFFSPQLIQQEINIDGCLDIPTTQYTGSHCVPLPQNSEWTKFDVRKQIDKSVRSGRT